MIQEKRGQMAESGGKREQDVKKVRVDGEEAVLHITDQSVMFEKGGKVNGFERSAIRLVKPDGDVMIIAYSAGSEVKSVRVEPMTAVASLLVPSSTLDQPQAPTTELDEVFERLYRDTRKELEDRLAKVQAEPENKSLRLTPDEEARYEKISQQMISIAGAMCGFDPKADTNPLSFWGLEKQPYELQLDVVKILHIFFLRGVVSPRAETEDIGYSAYEVWPDDWDHILVRFKLTDQPVLTSEFKSYLKSHWKYHPGSKKPALATA
jgi:hypothetical protein